MFPHGWALLGFVVTLTAYAVLLAASSLHERRRCRDRLSREIHRLFFYYHAN